MLRLWALSTASLLGVYGAQEWIEGVVHAGHPSGFDALVGHGGWIAVFLAGGFGALVAMALRGAEAVVRRAAKHRKRSFAGTRPVGQRFPRTPPRGALDPVPRFLAARGPPLTSI
jgi:hypothetical protein